MKYSLGGWQRIGIVLSALWLAYAAYAGLSENKTLTSMTQWELQHPERGTVTYAFSAHQPLDDIEDALSEITESMQTSEEKYSGQTIETRYIEYVKEHRPLIIRNHLLIGLLPVAALWLAGWCISWIRNGFRKAA